MNPFLTTLVAGEFPPFTPAGSWLLIFALILAVGSWVCRGIASGPDTLGEHRDYDDRIQAPYPPRPAGDDQ